MLRLIPDHLKTKKMCKSAVKKLLFVIRYLLVKISLKKCAMKLFYKLVESWGLFQSKCNKAVNSFVHALQFVSDCYKTQKVSNKAAHTSLSIIQFVPQSYKTDKMCDKAIDTFPFLFDSVPD